MKLLLFCLIFFMQFGIVDGRPISSLDILRALEANKDAMEAGMEATSTLETTLTPKMTSATLTTAPITNTIPTTTLTATSSCDRGEKPQGRIVPFLSSTTPSVTQALFYERALVDEALYQVEVKCSLDWAQCSSLIAEFYSAVDRQAHTGGVASPTLVNFLGSLWGWLLIIFGVFILVAVGLAWVTRRLSNSDVISILVDVLRMITGFASSPLMWLLGRHGNANLAAADAPSSVNWLHRMCTAVLEAVMSRCSRHSPSADVEPSPVVVEMELASLPVSCISCV
ncbi:MAG: hypothetical protein GY696_13285 [Gammaproteobacteria bacterium]|nr:hypothetical protein [Gammaproteobacteria bacterium]